jgi:hypothetical protein
MKVGIQEHSKSFAVRFRDLDLWNVGSQLIMKWGWPLELTRPLGDVLFRRIEPLGKDFPGEHPVQLLTIRFDGSIEPRPSISRNEIKGKLFQVWSGDVVFSKIDVRNGAIGLVPPDVENSFVTSEFPTYSVLLELADPQYIKLLFRTKVFMRILNSMISGASGRKRIQPGQLEDVVVPIPPLPIQKAIVEHWQKSIRKIAIFESKLSYIAGELNLVLQQLTHSNFTLKKLRFFIIDFSKALQWDLKAGRSAAFRKLNPDFLRLGDFAEECNELVKPWEEPEKEWPIYGVNNQVGVFFNCYQKGKDFNVPYKKIQKGWFFHNPTRANVGSLGIVPEVPIDAITSPEYQVWRLTGGFLPEFMALMIKTEYFLTLIDFNRVGAVKQRMYYANLAEIRLPLLEDDVQLRFADEWKTALAELSKAEQNLKIAQVEIEEMILGIRPAGGVQPGSS